MCNSFLNSILWVLSLTTVPYSFTAMATKAPNTPTKTDQLIVGVVAHPENSHSIKDSVNTFYGINLEYLSNISKAVGLKFELKAYPNVKSLLEAVESGEVDGAVGFSKTKEREPRFLFSKPFFHSSVAAWFQNKAYMQEPSREMTWACVRYTSYCDQIAQRGIESIHYAINLKSAFQAVKNGKAQALVSSYISINQYLDENNVIRGSVDIPEWLNAEDVRFITAKENQALIDQVNRVLKWEQSGLNIRSIASINPYHINDKLLQDYRKENPENPAILFSTSDNAHPFLYRDKQGNLDGFLSDFFQLLQARTGLNFKYVEPKANHQSDFTAFEADLVPVAYTTEIPSLEWKISKPFMQTEYISIESLSAKAQSVSAYQSGVLISLKKQGIVHLESWFDDDIKRYSDLTELLRDVRQGKLESAYIPSYVAHSIIAQNEASDLKIGQRDPLVISLAFAIADDNPEIKKLINSILENIDQKEIEKLSRSYLNFTLNYGYNSEHLLKIGLAIGLVFLVISVLMYFGMNNLKLKVSLAQLSADAEEKEKLWLKEIIQEISHLVFIHDENNTLLLSNCAKFQSGECGAGSCELRDKKNNLYLASDKTELRDILKGKRVSETHEIISCDKTLSVVHRERKSIYSLSSSKQFVLTIIQDITEQSLREKALVVAKQEAQEAVTSRERFLATMSHELRTPIAAVHSILDLLDRPTQKGKRPELLSQAQKSLHHLNSLVDEILDFSKLDAGKLTVEPVKTDLLNALGDILRSFEAQADNKALKYIVEIRPFKQRWYQIDPVRLAQILSNLLSNAIKFTAHGYIRTLVSLDDGWLKISISDSGIGMSEEQQQDVLKPFVQADNSITREFGGTGLGLSIVDKLILCLGGHFAISSIQAVGTTMEVELPIEPDTADGNFSLSHYSYHPALPAEISQWCRVWGMSPSEHNTLSIQPTAEESISIDVSSDAGVTLSSKEYKYPDLLLKAIENAERGAKEEATVTALVGNVLVAEDNKINQNILKMQLEELGLRYVIVNNGQEAYEYLQAHMDIDILLTDFHMPVMDGIELTTMLKKDNALSSLPIIGVTAEDYRVASDLAHQCGMNDIVFKPYNIQKLHDVISQFLDCSDAGKKPAWLDIYGEQESVSIAYLFIDSMNSDLAVLRSEVYEGTKRKAIHSIKGACHTIGLTQISEKCAAVEACNGEEFIRQTQHLDNLLSNEIRSTKKWVSQYEK